MNIKKRGPRMLPCGTPIDTGRGSESVHALKVSKLRMLRKIRRKPLNSGR